MGLRRGAPALASGIVNCEPVSAALCGYDLNGDGVVSIDDLGPFVERLLASEQATGR
jgi:hypothetical protein